MSDRYVTTAEIIAPMSKVVCARCGSLLPDTEGAREVHDNFHDRVEAALSASQGNPVA